MLLLIMSFAGSRSLIDKTLSAQLRPGLPPVRRNRYVFIRPCSFSSTNTNSCSGSYLWSMRLALNVFVLIFFNLSLGKIRERMSTFWMWLHCGINHNRASASRLVCDASRELNHVEIFLNPRKIRLASSPRPFWYRTFR